jgi:hypothetical protein
MRTFFFDLFQPLTGLVLLVRKLNWFFFGMTVHDSYRYPTLSGMGISYADPCILGCFFINRCQGLQPLTGLI